MFVDNTETNVNQFHLSFTPVSSRPTDQLYIVRNSNDVAMSYYHHFKLINSLEKNVQLLFIVKLLLANLLVHIGGSEIVVLADFL